MKEVLIAASFDDVIHQLDDTIQTTLSRSETDYADLPGYTSTAETPVESLDDELLTQLYQDSLVQAKRFTHGANRAISAEDIAMQTMEKVIKSERRIREIRDEQGLQATRRYVTRTAVNMGINGHRSEQRRPSSPTEKIYEAQMMRGESAPSAESVVMDLWTNDMRNALDNTTVSLPQLEAAILHYVEGYSHAEIAEMQDINIATVRTRLYRARAALRESPAMRQLWEARQDR